MTVFTKETQLAQEAMVRGQPYATAGRNGKNGNAMPPFPTRQMFVLGMKDGSNLTDVFVARTDALG